MDSTYSILRLAEPAAAVEAADSIGDARLGDWIGAAVSLAVAVAAAGVLRWLIRRFGERRDTVTSTVQIMARLVFFIVVAVGVYIALRTVGLDLAPVLAGAGIAGIALAFALQDIAENYISGVLMGFRNPFSPGDEIISGAAEGTVEELNLRYTTIRTYDGVRVLLPNSQVLKNPLTNLTVNGNRRTDFTIGVAYGTDLQRAREAAMAAVSAVPGVETDRGVQAWVEELAASWINIRVRYWHPPRIADVWEVRSAAIIAVVDATVRERIDLPFERSIVEVVSHAGTEAPQSAPVDELGDRVRGAGAEGG